MIICNEIETLIWNCYYCCYSTSQLWSFVPIEEIHFCLSHTITAAGAAAVVVEKKGIKIILVDVSKGRGE